MSFWVACAAGLVCGVISGFGIGGGSLLMVWMTAVEGLAQHTAQGINLLYFLPTAAAALVLHVKNRYVKWAVVLPAAISGSVVSALTALLAAGLEASLLRRIFGVFLLLVGASELFCRRERRL
jgi:uncharacterized membrane protein YfcA